ncbi:MAG: hypothetical protein JXO44_06680, partial [Clostridia bacterium]|nr:hypothetical protein [Clostridia bacterium]
LSHDLTLEREADAMGTKANRLVSKYPTKKLVSKKANSNLIQCYLDDEQRENIHGLFSGAYGTATFKRMSFSKEDRQLAWMGQAHAEMDLSGAAVDPEIIEATITEMGLTAQGINLRHVIPYSDIAGVLRVATSDSTISVAGPDYARSIRHQVTKLTELIGSEESKRLWAEGVDSVGLLKSKSGRDVIRGIYRDLAHSQANLFQGSGSPNKAIGNRPDVSVYATGILGRGHVEKLLEWWYETMEILELNPIFSQERVYNISSGTAIPVDLHSHALSRPLGPIYGYSDELEMIPRN